MRTSLEELYTQYETSIEKQKKTIEENRRRLKANGAEIRDERPLRDHQERDVVTNYHVRQILSLRVDLLESLKILKKGE